MNKVLQDYNSVWSRNITQKVQFLSRTFKSEWKVNGLQAEVP